MRLRAKPWILGGVTALSALACDGQQYVNPDTVALVVLDEATGAPRVNQCHYVPVLLGSELLAQYDVAEQLRATLTVTRETVSVRFEDAGQSLPTFTVDSEELSGTVSLVAPAPPRGFSVELRSPCTPRD
jgi:hypothetical protein